VGNDGGDIVVSENPKPPEPTEIVCPLTTIVVEGAPAPIANVVPAITAEEGANRTGTPLTVVGVATGLKMPGLVGRGMTTPGPIA
jgi:hypothetical protein